MREIHELLKTYWGYDKFRPLQEDIIRTVLQGKDCLALLPTGGGKSICFQVPAMAMDGLCLVISPLIALMKDQVTNLRKKNITAFSIHSGLSRQEVRQTLEVAGSSNCKFLYVSPERLETALFKEYLLSLNVTMIAVDEAHCISQWGYDFRPAYLRIALLRQELPGVPVLALTASATSQVQTDICEKLCFDANRIFRQSFARPKLSYSVFQVSSKINKMLDILRKVPGSAIVYCRSRKRTKEFSDLLKMHGISSDFYHAGLPQEDRNDRQEAWIKNTTRVIVCTNAFGMGIDKPDVRLVIHADLPECLENYYQEAGRAGRDGKRCYAVLLFQDRDAQELKASIDVKFPDLLFLKKVYGSLMNYLQIPAGYGSGQSFDFDLNTFAASFNLKPRELVAALKTLEQEGHLYFNEQVFTPSKLQVIAERDVLSSLDSRWLEAAEMARALLRTYAGIRDIETTIIEKTLANLTGLELTYIPQLLKKLQDAGIVRYFPQKEKPQVYLPVDRVQSSDLYVDEVKYSERKKQHAGRLQQLVSFVQTHEDCRSRFIGNYFGDNEMGDCGICDNCLRRKKTPVSGSEFDSVQKAIYGIIREGPVNLHELLNRIAPVQPEKTREVLRYLQAEEAISIDTHGNVVLVE
jgi:ATP-dependent DNA helicase RecQ